MATILTILGTDTFRSLIEKLRTEGFSLRVELGNLIVSPWSRCTSTAA